MNDANGRLSSDHELSEYGESIDLGAMTGTDHGEMFQPTLPTDGSSRLPSSQLQRPLMIHKLLRYPPQGSLEIRPTSWLDGVRGIAALEVYIFHTMALWVSVAPAW